MSIYHVVLFQFKAGASPEAVKETCARMLALKDACLHPKTAKTYIKSSTGGKDNSIEGMQHGLTHGFVVEFASVDDRDFYVREDKAHHEFIATYITGPRAVVEKATVVDFAAGVFT